MTQNQDNIRTMFVTTLAFLDENDSVWTSKVAFADAVARAKAGVDAITDTTAKQQTPTEGVAGDKGALRDALEEKLLEVADQLAAFAAKSGDNDLAAKVAMTKSSIDQMQDNDLDEAAGRVADLATENKTALADYDVTNADITQLKNARTAFGGAKTGPREAAVERKASTQALPELIATVRSIFRNELDKMMTKFKKPNTEFYNGYFAARIIVNRAATLKTPTTPPPPSGP